MKKQTVYCALALSGALLLGSCASSIRHNITQARARLLESEFNVVTNPIVGELDCMATVKMADSMEFYIGGFTNAETQIRPYLDEYKRYTVANYCMKHGYDLIVGPLFQIKTNPEDDLMKVIVTGFPARYKSFRQATAADDWMLPLLRPDDGDGTIDIKLEK